MSRHRTFVRCVAPAGPRPVEAPSGRSASCGNCSKRQDGSLLPWPAACPGSDSVRFVVVRETQQSHRAVSDVRLEEEHEQATDVDTTDALEWGPQGFVMQRGFAELRDHGVDRASRAGVPAAQLPVTLLELGRNFEGPAHFGASSSAVGDRILRNRPRRIRWRLSTNLGRRAGSRILSSWAATMASMASFFPRRPSRALTTFTIRLACSERSTTDFGIASNILQYLEHTRWTVSNETLDGPNACRRGIARAERTISWGETGLKDPSDAPASNFRPLRGPGSPPTSQLGRLAGRGSPVNRPRSSSLRSNPRTPPCSMFPARSHSLDGPSRRRSDTVGRP